MAKVKESVMEVEMRKNSVVCPGVYEERDYLVLFIFKRNGKDDERTVLYERFQISISIRYYSNQFDFARFMGSMKEREMWSIRNELLIRIILEVTSEITRPTKDTSHTGERIARQNVTLDGTSTLRPFYYNHEHMKYKSEGLPLLSEDLIDIDASQK
ncbi:hypothetical protein V1478_005360 [Vespula squamosa]|uniref:Uncharacterized protein n=1 Tax=Vespula squamosa TaxID=30214 RepID=A0ABD2BDX4_VESSQ